MALIGRGNNNRPLYRKRALASQIKHEAELRERQKMMQARKKTK